MKSRRTSTMRFRAGSVARETDPLSTGPAIVVTGFEPFDGRSKNRSWEVVRRLSARPGLETLQLPVDFAALKRAVPGLARGKPRALLLVGESSAGTVCVEQVALNIVDTDRPDNAGATPRAGAIVADGPLALRSSWDARALAQALVGRGIPTVPSFHAGTYACNAALYLALHSLPRRTRIGFMHFPHRPRPGLGLGVLVRAVELGMQALLEPDRNA